MLLHYSISFKNAPIKYHGEVEYPLNVFQNSEPYIESMTAFVRADLAKSIKKWGHTPDEMIKAEFYFYRGSEEVIFFQWEKETVNNEET